MCTTKRESARNDRRGPRKGFYSSPQWRRLRALKLAEDPLCARCGSAANEVHHCKPVVTHPELALVKSNLESLCKPCHSRETIGELRDGVV